MRSLTILMALSLAALPGAARAGQSSAGGESFDFLLLDADARAVALGGAYTALATDANALLYNPGALGRIRNSEVSFMHNQYVEGLTQEYGAYAAPQGWGAQINRLDFGDITRTTLSHKDGDGSFGISDLSVGAGYGRALTDWASLGLGFKYLRESIDNVTANGCAFDAGALFSVPRVQGLSLGASLLNLGPRVRFMTLEEKLPLMMRAGAAYKRSFLGADNTFAFDLSKALTDGVRFGLGAETLLYMMLALRFGYTSRNDTDIGITFGAGVLWRSFGADYAVVPFGEMGYAHRISLTYRWGERESEGVSKRRTPQAEPELTVEGRLRRGQEAVLHEKWEQAKAEYGAAAAMLTSSDQRMIMYYERMGYIFLRQGEATKAKGYYMEGLKMATSLGLRDQGVADLYVGMGECLRQEGNPEEAAQFYKKALDIGVSDKSRRIIEKGLSAPAPAPQPVKATVLPSEGPVVLPAR